MKILQDINNLDDMIGNVINCDCLELMKNMPNECLDSIITDVPYNTGMSQKTSSGSTRLSHFFEDNYTEQDYQSLVENCCREFWRLLKNDKYIYIYINWKEYPRWFNELKKVGFEIKACIVWDKLVHGLGSQYKYQHEFIIFAEKGNPPIKQPSELGKYFTDIWRVQRINPLEKEHDTQKVLEIVNLPVLHSTQKGDIVFDPFLGSGTTALACEMLGRRWIGCELEEKYCKIADDRIKNYQNQLQLF